MFISTRAHQAILQAKDAHIAHLKDEVSFLRRMVQPGKLSTDSQIEADAVLEGRQDQIPRDPKQEAINTEAALLLSGNY